jgi:hypothetical protein
MHTKSRSTTGVTPPPNRLRARSDPKNGRTLMADTKLNNTSLRVLRTIEKDALPLLSAVRVLCRFGRTPFTKSVKRRHKSRAMTFAHPYPCRCVCLPRAVSRLRQATVRVLKRSCEGLFENVRRTIFENKQYGTHCEIVWGKPGMPEPATLDINLAKYDGNTATEEKPYPNRAQLRSHNVFRVCLHAV